MEERGTQTKNIVVIPGGFINGNRNGDNICATPRGLDHGETVTAASAPQTPFTLHAPHATVASMSPGTSRPLTTTPATASLLK